MKTDTQSGAPSSRNEEIGRLTREVVPGGVMSNWKKSGLFEPYFVASAKGARLVDVDGNEIIDYSLSLGPAILGHSNEAVIEALSSQARTLYTGEPTELQYQAAAKIVEHVPSAELVRFAVTGTEVNLTALRVARAHTGRNYFVRFNGQYNGSADNIIGGITDNADFPVPHKGFHEYDLFSKLADTGGRADHAFDDCLMIEWNDLEALERLFANHGDKIAAVLMEPIMINMAGCTPEPGYLEGVRELCTRYGVVLIFDEVITGFRAGLNSAQGLYGVTPDMTTLAKALGAGFPVAAFCGTKEIMDTVTDMKVLAGGTYNGHPMAMAACIATIGELEKDNGAAYDHINRMGNRLWKGVHEASKQAGSNLLLQGIPGALTCNFSDKEKIINHADNLEEPDGVVKLRVFGDLMRKRGIMCLGRFCTSLAHTEEDVDETLNRTEDALRALEKGSA